MQKMGNENRNRISQQRRTSHGPNLHNLSNVLYSKRGKKWFQLEFWSSSERRIIQESSWTTELIL